MKLLLHVCCAPCCTYPIKKLRNQFDITAYFYGPNIHPEKEYKTRLLEFKNYCGKHHIKYIEAPYEVEKWFELTKGLENEPERGKRCAICYEMRMRKTAEYASKNNFEYFDTTLSLSPHKDFKLISEIGNKLATEFNVKYFGGNFKKEDGFKKSVEISEKAGLYRQNYCGCVYSVRSSQ